MSSRSSRIIYVGNLPGDIRMREVEDLFHKFGPIVDIDLKIPPRPPGYAFVEFEDARDAEDAIYYRDGYKFDGHRMRVELAHGGRGHSSSVERYSSSSGSRGISRRSDYRVLITGLPSSASWQDLKDHMRKAGDVCFSQVFREHGGMTGIVDYTNYDDMKYAIRKLDDSEFRNAFSRSYIRVREYDRRSYSRSPKRDSGSSYSRSPSRSPCMSRSRSRSPYMSRSRSRSHSRSFSDRSRSLSPKAKRSQRSVSRSSILRIKVDDHGSVSKILGMWKDGGALKKQIIGSLSRSRSPNSSPSPRKSRIPSQSPGRSTSQSRSPSVRSERRGSVNSGESN